MKSQIIKTGSGGFQCPQDVLQSIIHELMPPDLLPIQLKVICYFCSTSNNFNKLLLRLIVFSWNNAVYTVEILSYKHTETKRKESEFTEAET